MTVLGRMAPHRLSQRLSFLIVDPHAVDGLAMVRAFKERGIAAEVSTSVAHGISTAHRNQHNVVIIRDADVFTPAEVSLFSRLASTRTCVVQTERDSPLADAVRRGVIDAKIVPRSIDLVDLLGAVRWALQSTAVKPKAAKVTEAANEQPEVQAVAPVRRTTKRFIPAVSYKYDR